MIQKIYYDRFVPVRRRESGIIEARFLETGNSFISMQKKLEETRLEYPEWDAANPVVDYICADIVVADCSIGWLLRLIERMQRCISSIAGKFKK